MTDDNSRIAERQSPIAGMSLLLFKHLHVSFAALSLLGFVTRGVWMWRDSPRLERRWVRIAPHVVDTLLLLSGLTMVFVFYGAYPGHWLTAKLVALAGYIVLGSVALKRGRTRRVRGVAFATALVVFGYIVAVALTRSPWPIA